ncbi:FAD binding domain-containing protein [Poronia punctata]|nr:FAD binding domain-containing protein [Poronia punctata]
MERPFKKVLIVGAGPSGLLLALLLSQHGIPVEVFEASDESHDKQPRAAIYGSAAIPELRRAGIIDEIRSRGMTPTTMSWRRWDDHSVIATIDTSVMNKDGEEEDLRLACLPLDKLCQLMLERFEGKIYWRHKVVGAGQDKEQERAWIDVEGEGRFYGDYVVGCDGASSRVRKSLFGDEFPGWTWDTTIVATNAYFDFSKFGWSDANFIVHPEHFFMSAKLTKYGLYRVTYGEKAGLTWSEMKARLPQKFQTILPGHPGPDENAYEVVSMSPYKMHQRCAPKFRLGRILLAADAAHVCNPWGGLGITGGFVDVGGLYDCLAGIWDGRADESILDLYSEMRMEKWKEVIDVTSVNNFKTVSNPDAVPDPKALEELPFFRACRDMVGDDEAVRDWVMQGFAMRYDFTRHYRDV